MKKNAQSSTFKAGMFLLENLTSGMYNDPLTIYREYIQNSVDAIEVKLNPKGASISIELDPFNKTISVSDTGVGISSREAESILGSIGCSNKAETGLRGFRGIGRLGGLAFCDRAIFRTKAVGENIESIQEWDCKHLRHILSNHKKTPFTLQELFYNVTKLYKENHKKPDDSYFKVTLEGVSSFRNYIFDIHKVKNYISQVAPAPLDHNQFKFAGMLNNYLKAKIATYKTFPIYLNGEKIYKPYRNEFRTTNKGSDFLDDVEPFVLKAENQVLAYGWYGKRNNFLGAINRTENIAGIRVRAGNILIGDAHLLDECFREPRFNGYVIGEIHIVSKEIIPNSRRDDFVDNPTKAFFYNAVEKEIGLSLSKQIRAQSQKLSKQKSSNSQLPISIEKNAPPQSASPDQQSRNFVKPDLIKQTEKELLNKIISSCGKCAKLAAILNIK